jgi:hypothetical protein
MTPDPARPTDKFRPRGGRALRGAYLASGAAAVAAVALLALPSGAFGLLTPMGSQNALPLTTTCNPKNPSPSALDIPGTNAGHAVAGDLLNATLEFLVANYTKADKGLWILFPSVTAVFPESPSGSVSVFIAARTVVVLGSQWSNASLFAGSTTLSGTPTFNPNGTAYLSTSKVALMATTTTGSLTLKVRWHWTLFHVKTGARASGAWTSPSRYAKSPYLPSIFFPAAYVGIVSTSGPSVPTNSTYSVVLNGSVSSTWFRMVIEYPNNGTEIQSIIENTTANATTFNATLPVTFRNGTGIPSGKYLIHVHDSCQAIVHLLQVSVY